MLNRLKQYDWRNFNYSLVIIVVILCLVSAFTLKLAGGPAGAFLPIFVPGGNVHGVVTIP